LSRDDLRFGDKMRPINEMPECRLELSLGEHWFVAQTLHHREKLAALHLGAQGFRSFLPRFRKTVRHARQLREVVVPVFPGYIFLILDPERDRWRWHCHVRVFYLSTAPDVGWPTRAKSMICLSGSRTEIAQKVPMLGERDNALKWATAIGAALGSV
jgi:hypothetical protein